MSADSHLSFSALGNRLRPPMVTTLMAAALENPDMLSLAAGFTDTATLPANDVARGVAELGAREGPPEHLQYGTNVGRPGLRAWVARHILQLDGLPIDRIDPADVIIANGSQQLLHLAVQVLCDRGDIVLVEAPTYFVFLEILRGLDVRAVALPENVAGELDFRAIRERLRALRQEDTRARVKALYLQSYFANPSGRSRSEAEKSELAATLRGEGFVVPVIEDAAYRDLWFEAPHPARSTLALDAWRDFPRLYLGTLTKPFASGLKVGYGCCTERAWLDRLAWLKGHADFGTANFSQAILEHALLAGRFEEHLQRVRPIYRRKMHRLHDALESAGLRELGWTWLPTAGGLTMWLAAPSHVDTQGGGPLWNAALEEGVLYVPGDLCFGESAPTRFVRLSFGVLGDDRLGEAARRFVRAAARAGAAAGPDFSGTGSDRT